MSLLAAKIFPAAKCRRERGASGSRLSTLRRRERGRIGPAPVNASPQGKRSHRPRACQRFAAGERGRIGPVPANASPQGKRPHRARAAPVGGLPAAGKARSLPGGPLSRAASASVHSRSRRRCPSLWRFPHRRRRRRSRAPARCRTADRGRGRRRACARRWGSGDRGR